MTSFLIPTAEPIPITSISTEIAVELGKKCISWKLFFSAFLQFFQEAPLTNFKLSMFGLLHMFSAVLSMQFWFSAKLITFFFL